MLHYVHQLVAKFAACSGFIRAFLTKNSSLLLQVDESGETGGKQSSCGYKNQNNEPKDAKTLHRAEGNCWVMITSNIFHITQSHFFHFNINILISAANLMLIKETFCFKSSYFCMSTYNNLQLHHSHPLLLPFCFFYHDFSGSCTGRWHLQMIPPTKVWK